MSDDDEFEAAFVEFAEASRRRGGRPRKAHQAELIRLAVERGVKAGLPLARDDGQAPKRTAFDEAAEMLKSRFGVVMTSEAVIKAYYGRKGSVGIKRVEEIKARSEPY